MHPGDVPAADPSEDAYIQRTPYHTYRICPAKPRNQFEKAVVQIHSFAGKYESVADTKDVEPHGLTAVAPLHTLRRAEPSDLRRP